ncbi:MAG: hypothetical protein ACYC8T_33885 [Myxococcaceae bacterium]
MTSGPLKRRWVPALFLAGGFCALASLLFLALRIDEGLWDWDTYGRLKFIHHYQPDLWLDGHVLYHRVMQGLMAVGVRPVASLWAMTAAGAAAFICLTGFICRREGLSGRATALVMLAATVGSPGLVSLFLLVEDNVAYLPIVLAVFYLLYREDRDPAAATRSGAALGVLFAAGMLINVSLLVLLFAGLCAPLLWRRQRLRAVRLLTALGVALVTYYLAHLLPFIGAKVALHEFLPQALRLQDFAGSDSALLSGARLGQYLGGLRAVALTPSVHLMRLPPWVLTALVSWAPKLLAALYLALVAERVLARGGELWAALKQRLDLAALFGVAVVFPYFYEPALIERWDIFWVGLLLGLVVLMKTRPSRLAQGLVLAIIALQAAGSAVAITHQYGGAFAEPGFVQMRTQLQDVVAHDSDPVVLPYDVDRLLLADLVTRSGARTVYLVRASGNELICFRLFDLMERPAPLAELQQRLRSGNSVFVDPALSRHSLRLLGVAPR